MQLDKMSLLIIGLIFSFFLKIVLSKRSPLVFSTVFPRNGKQTAIFLFTITFWSNVIDITIYKVSMAFVCYQLSLMKEIFNEENSEKHLKSSFNVYNNVIDSSKRD